MKTYLAIFTLIFCSVRTYAVTSAGLCNQYQGSYLGTLEGQPDPVRINLVCLDSNRVAVTLANPDSPESLIYGTFTFAHIEKDDLVVANFPITAEDRRTVSANTSLSYVKVSLAALAQGRINGTFMNNLLASPLALSGRKVQTFEGVTAPKCMTANPSRMIGAYTLDDDQVPQLYFDWVDGAPLFNLSDDSIFAIHLVDAPTWNGKGSFVASTPFGNGEPQVQMFYQIRGCVTGPKTLSVGIITARSGLRGPFKATKQ